MSTEDRDMQAAELAADLPPADLEQDGPDTLNELEQGQGGPADQAAQPVHVSDPETLDKIASGIIATVADMGAATLPAEYHADYIRTFTSSPLIRRGLHLSGLPGALDELAPATGGGDGPAKQLPAWVRLAAGVAVLGLATVFSLRPYRVPPTT